jgi:hypothetical protein
MKTSPSLLHVAFSVIASTLCLQAEYAVNTITVAATITYEAEPIYTETDTSYSSAEKTDKAKVTNKSILDNMVEDGQLETAVGYAIIEVWSWYPSIDDISSPDRGTAFYAYNSKTLDLVEISNELLYIDNESVNTVSLGSEKGSYVPTDSGYSSSYSATYSETGRAGNISVYWDMGAAKITAKIKASASESYNYDTDTETRKVSFSAAWTANVLCDYVSENEDVGSEILEGTISSKAGKVLSYLPWEQY